MQKPNAANYDVFNIGTGKGSTVLEVIKTFEAVSGQKLNYEVGPRRPGDVEQVYGDVRKAESKLGCKAKLVLSDMMRSAWAWEKYLLEHPI